MDELFLHIEYLLRHHDCVILPGIGAFLSIRREAFVDMERGVALPPSREIRFNSSIINNDGLLASSISRRSQISYEEGERLLDDMTRRLRECLKEEGEIAIGDIGSLMLDSGGRLSFRQRFSARTFADYLGFSPAPLPDFRPAADVADVRAPRPRPDKYYYIAVNKTFVKAAAVFITLLTVCMSVFLPIPGDAPRREYASVVPVVSVVEKAARQTVDKVVKAPARKQNGRQTLEETECHGRHFLIVGSFRTLEEARNFASADTDARIIAGKRIYMVSVFDSSDRAATVEAMRSPSVTSRYSQSWIWSPGN